MADRKSTSRNRLISSCPVCAGQLYVTHLRCSDCSTELSGEFLANEFARLPQDQLLEALHLEGQADPAVDEDSDEVLDALARGELSVEEAEKRLKH